MPLELPIVSVLRQRRTKIDKTAGNMIAHAYKLIDAHIAIMAPNPRKDEFAALLEWMRKEPPDEK